MTAAPIAQPTPATAEVFHRKMGAGRNGALLLSVRDGEGQLVDCVVKVKALMELAYNHPVPALAEWLAAVLAQEFGIPCPKPYNVEITAEFARSVSDASVAAALGKSVGFEYGGAFIKGLGMVRADLLVKQMKLPAAHLLAFDLFIHNVDRRADNPNLLLLRDSFVALDHGDAFSFLLPVIGGSDPATDPLTSVVARHVMTPLLKQSEVDFSEFRRNVQLLTDARLGEIARAAPPVWCAGSAAGVLEKVLETLRRRRDAVGSWLLEVEAWLTQR